MKRNRRNAFAVGKKGDVSPAETLPSPDYSQDGVFDMVPSSHGVVLRSDAEDDESHSPSCLHLTEVQVQGTIITSSRANISMFFFFIKNYVNQRARISFCIEYSTLTLYYSYSIPGKLYDTSTHSVFLVILI